jgi:iron complex outermembrane receptor protein
MRVAAILLAGTALFCSANPAFAQAPDTTGQGRSRDNVDDVSQDIIVTAQKESQSLQKAPAAITVIDSSALQSRGVSDLSLASTLIPSARFNIQTNSVQLFIRGVGTNVDTPHIPSSVALQLNGVFVPDHASRASFFDVGSVEILPGPQGTLYGQNAIGGVVSVNAKRPAPELGLEASAEAGNYGLAHFTAAADVPLSQTTSIRIAGDYNHHDYYNSNRTDDMNAVQTRLSLLSKPSSSVTIYLWGGYYHNKYISSPTFYLPVGDNPRDHVDDTDPTRAFFYPPNGYSTRNPPTTAKAYQVGGEIDINVGSVDFTYIPGYTRYKTVNFGTISGFPLFVVDDGDIFSNELRLANADRTQALNWIFGLYQLNTKDRHYETFGVTPSNEGPLLAGADVPSRKSTYAVFGQATYSFSDALRGTLGGRYSRQSLKTSNATTLGFDFGTFSRISTPFAYDESWKRFDWKVSMEADVSQHSLLYANVQSGFNPGTFRQDLSQASPFFKIRPQKMIGFTAGSKNRFFDNKVTANIELFYYRYRDQIIQAQQLNTAILVNADRSRSFGVQFDGAVSVGPLTRLTLNAGYLNSKISKFVNTAGPVAVDLAGATLPYAPKWTISGGFDHRFALSSGAELKFSANSAFNSGYFLTFQRPPNLRQNSFTKTDLSLTYTPASGAFDIGLWVRNVENSVAIAAAAVTGDPPPREGAAFLEPPRTFGVRLQAKM